jgi:hypothetical protein
VVLGTVYDQAGRPKPDATVVVSERDGRNTEVRTGATGRFLACTDGAVRRVSVGADGATTVERLIEDGGHVIRLRIAMEPSP